MHLHHPSLIEFYRVHNGEGVAPPELLSKRLLSNTGRQWHDQSEMMTRLQVVCGTMGLPTATVRMRGPDGIARTSTGMGTGPVDAAYKAIDSLVRVQVHSLP